jgi:hypothetical protein
VDSGLNRNFFGGPSKRGEEDLQNPSELKAGIHVCVNHGSVSPGVTAFGMAVGLTTLSTTALAQPAAPTASPYAPPVPQSKHYRPDPIRPYVPSYGSAAPAPSTVRMDANPSSPRPEDRFQPRRGADLLALSASRSSSY